MAAAKAAAAEKALVAAKAAPESMYESNYVADPTPEAQLDGMDAALDMLIQIQPSSETMKAVQAAKAAMKADSPAKAATSKEAMVEQVVEPASGPGIYSADRVISAEEQEGAMDSVFDMLVQLPEHKDDATSKLKATLKKKEQEVRALKAKIAAKAKPERHQAKKAPEEEAPPMRHDERRSKHEKDSSVEELDEDGDMDAADVEEEQEDEEEVTDNQPRREAPEQEVEDWSPPARSIPPRTQRKAATFVAAKSPVIVDSGLSKDPEATAALAAVNSGAQAPAGASVSESPAPSTSYGGETTPNMGNILKPNMHVLKPAQVRQEEHKDEVKVEAAAAKKEYYKIVDLNNPGAAAARKARQAKGLAAYKRIAGLQSNGQTQVWLLGCSGNAACEDDFDDAS